MNLLSEESTSSSLYFILTMACLWPINFAQIQKNLGDIKYYPSGDGAVVSDITELGDVEASGGVLEGEAQVSGVVVLILGVVDGIAQGRLGCGHWQWPSCGCGTPSILPSFLLSLICNNS